MHDKDVGLEVLFAAIACVRACALHIYVIGRTYGHGGNGSLLCVSSLLCHLPVPGCFVIQHCPRPLSPLAASFRSFYMYVIVMLAQTTMLVVAAVRVRPTPRGWVGRPPAAGVNLQSYHRWYGGGTSCHGVTNSCDRRKRHIWALHVRGGGGGDSGSPLLNNGSRVSSFTTDATNTENEVNNDTNLPHLLNQFPVTGCAAIGGRTYMEDEALIQSDMVAVFDGHGGASVSRYVRQNIYGHIQAILPHVVEERMKADKNNNRSNTSSGSDDAVSHTPPSPTLVDYENTLRQALDRVNKEVLRIVHWSYQGSTAVVCWLHENMLPTSDISASSTTDDGDDAENVASDSVVRTLVAANIGDSRLVLSRDGMAIPLSRDHKPDDPIEMEYIHSQGGKVTYPSGVPRVNGVMALSRAIGDRSETPSIRAEPDLIVHELMYNDNFYILATDGLWDVFSNQEVVSFLQSVYTEGELSDTARQEITKDLVLEGLARGAEDNVTVIVVWLK